MSLSPLFQFPKGTGREVMGDTLQVLALDFPAKVRHCAARNGMPQD